jgi:hypothetical protein
MRIGNQTENTLILVAKQDLYHRKFEEPRLVPAAHAVRVAPSCHGAKKQTCHLGVCWE